MLRGPLPRAHYSPQGARQAQQAAAHASAMLNKLPRKLALVNVWGG